MINKLTEIVINGFKSIESLSLKPRDINVMIGPNGSGKSNFISFFRMLNWMLGDPPRLQEFIALNGFAHSLLHDGPKVTKDITAYLKLNTYLHGDHEYQFKLTHASGDVLIFSSEEIKYPPGANKPYISLPDDINDWHGLAVGHRESRLEDWTYKDNEIHDANVGNLSIMGYLRGLAAYQFHDTSFSSSIRQKHEISDGKKLKEDGGNLCPFLLTMKTKHPQHYMKVIEIFRLIAPFFNDFVFEEENGYSLLKWREKNCDEIFNVGQASDGMLRTIALIALLCQPKENIPDVLFIDEPELGLHPYAINIIAGLIKSVALSRQVFVATQSPLFINQFEPEDIIVVDREGRNSKFTQLNSKDLEDWLREYSLADLWEKNVIGGRP